MTQQMIPITGKQESSLTFYCQEKVFEKVEVDGWGHKSPAFDTGDFCLSAC